MVHRRYVFQAAANGSMAESTASVTHSPVVHYVRTYVLLSCIKQRDQYGPCVHNVAHAKAVNVPPHRLVHPRYSTWWWQQQYALLGTSHVPEWDDVSTALKCSPALLVPPLLEAPKKGRIGKLRYKKALETTKRKPGKASKHATKKGRQ